MSDWSKHAAHLLKQKSEDEKLQSQKALQDTELLNLEAPKRWEELKNFLMQMATELNAEEGMAGTLHYDQSLPAVLVLTMAGKHRSIRITFDPRLPAVQLNDRFGTVHRIVVAPGSRVVHFQDAHSNIPIATEAIARKILDELLEVR